MYLQLAILITEFVLVILKEIGNMIIQKSIACCDQQSMFFGEPFEQVTKIGQILENIDFFLYVRSISIFYFRSIYSISFSIKEDLWVQ